MESVSFIQWCLDNLNYWTITLLMTIESSFIPFPSEVVVPPAAYNAAAGELNIYMVVLCATIGACLGALVNYGLALWIGRPLVYKFADSRLGRLLLLSGEKIEVAEKYFRDHGVVSTLVGRLIPAVRQLISIPAGLAKMKLHVFLLFTAIGAGIWNVILAALGYYMAYIPGLQTEEAVMNKVKEYSSEIGIVFIVVAVFVVAYLAYKGLKKK